MTVTAKIYNLLLSILFAAMISVGLLNDVFRFYRVPDISKTENRKLASKPVFDIRKLDPFPKLYENYFNDQFPYRKELSFMNTLICFYGFHQSPLPGEVDLGTNGWLFFGQTEGGVYQGKLTLTDLQVASLVKDLHQRTLEYGKKGIKFYIAFPPLKHEIYPEFLPRDIMRGLNGTVTDKIINAIKADTVIQYIDLKQTLLQAKPQGRMYYMTDNHWNWIGAFYGYSGIINRLRKDFPAIKPLTRSDFHYVVKINPPGNLAIMIGLSDYFTETEYYPVFDKLRSKPLAATHKKPDWASQIPNYEVVKSTGDTTLPSTVIIHDSYTNAMMPFLDESFNTNTYIFDGWRYGKNEAVIAEVKPEIVLLIIFEPHIAHLVGKW